MGNHISALRRHQRCSSTDGARGKRLKIAVLGASGVGKTTLFRHLLDHLEEKEYDPTTTVNIGAKLIQLENRLPVLVELWDVPDQVYAGKAIFETYFRALDGAILVYDTTSATSWQTLVEYHALLVAHTAETQPQVMLVVGNKIDLASTLPTEITRLADEWVVHQQQTSASLSIHHTKVSATQHLHTLELLRTLVSFSFRSM